MANPTMKFGELVLEIVDPHNIQPVMCDLSVELREMNGIICVSFGTVVTDGDAQPKIMVTSRMRFSLASASDFKTALEQTLKKAMSTDGPKN